MAEYEAAEYEAAEYGAEYEAAAWQQQSGDAWQKPQKWGWKEGGQRRAISSNVPRSDYWQKMIEWHGGHEQAKKAQAEKGKGKGTKGKGKGKGTEPNKLVIKKEIKSTSQIKGNGKTNGKGHGKGQASHGSGGSFFFCKFYGFTLYFAFCFPADPNKLQQAKF